MNRTSQYKRLYLLAMILIGAPVVFCIFYFRLSLQAVMLVAVLLLIPGRLPGFFWRDFSRGRKLLSTGDWESSLKYFERFLSEVKRRPWLKHFIWLSWGFYTRDIEVMTHNNMGAAQLGLGQLAEAEQHFDMARQIDSQAPLPYYNRALLAQIRGDADSAKALLEKSQILGYRGTTYDKLIEVAGSVLAQIEGHGAG